MNKTLIALILALSLTGCKSVSNPNGLTFGQGLKLAVDTILFIGDDSEEETEEVGELNE